MQTLEPRDYDARVDLCRQILSKINKYAGFFDQILWSDKSSVKRDGYLNLHILNRWQLENPHIVCENRYQYQFKIIYWTGILNGQIIGPFKLPGNLDGRSYLSFFQNDLLGLLEDVALVVRLRMWLQNDGCPATLHLGPTPRIPTDGSAAWDLFYDHHDRAT